MRVIAGTARRLLLVTPEGLDTRPTTDRIKETLFNILQYDVPGCRFLDLFAGSGGIGIEALSRGAEYAVFVDNNAQALKCIRQNLQKTGFEKNSLVLGHDCLAALRVLGRENKPFDIIFIDPPYGLHIEGSVLSGLRESGLADENTLVVIEAALDREFGDEELCGFEVERIKGYKTNKHVFLKIKRQA